MRRREGQVAARRVKVAAAWAMTGGLLAAAAAFAMSHGPAGHRETTLASAANVGRERAEPAALRVLSISPGSSADPVTAADPVRVVFSAPLAPASPLPAFSPAISGRWLAVGGGALVFAPAAPLRATTKLTLRIPAGSSGVRSAAGAALAAPVTAVFQAGGWSTLRLEQLLAQTGYLPLIWTRGSDSGLPAAPGGGPVTVSYTERRGAADPVGNTGGGFSWRGSYPSALTSLWRPGQRGVILTGALMAFQADHGLPMTGAVSPRLWRALLRGAVRGEHNPLGYSYALADQARPETLTVWHDGQVVVRGLASTGTAVTPTVLGTFPVYLRNRFQVMRGLMPDGSPYADPVQFVSYFHGDYAVHSMNRPSFGWPQSLGCVELPLGVARRVWPYLTYGSLVTVTG